MASTPWRPGLGSARGTYRDSSRSLVAAVVSALASSGPSPNRLELEITESILLAENESNLAVLHRLRDLGGRIAMDNFGTGNRPAR